jgi:hypothetical protein
VSSRLGVGDTGARRRVLLRASRAHRNAALKFTLPREVASRLSTACNARDVVPADTRRRHGTIIYVEGTAPRRHPLSFSGFAGPAPEVTTSIAMPPETSAAADASTAPTPSPSIADTLRAYAAGIIADPLNRKGLSKAWADAPQSLATARGVVDKVAGYLPMPQSIRDHFSDIEDLGQDTADAALSKNPMDALKAEAASIGNGLRQGVAGFNEGVGPVFTAPADALASLSDAVGNKVGGYFGSPPVNLPMPSKMYNDAFVVPSGPPQTKGQKLMRAGGNAVGQSVPMMAGGLGLATSGARSGISMAQQAAGGLVDSIEAPAATSTALSDTLRNAIPQANTWVRSNVPLASSVIDAHTAMIPRAAKDYLASKAGNMAGTPETWWIWSIPPTFKAGCRE